MSSENIDYQKALETVANTYPPARGFSEEAAATIPGDKIIVQQNNLIIELLIQLHRKLDILVSTPAPKIPAFEDVLAKINRNLETLYVSTRKQPAKSSSQHLVVWTDPKTLFPKKQ